MCYRMRMSLYNTLISFISYANILSSHGGDFIGRSLLRPLQEVPWSEEEDEKNCRQEKRPCWKKNTYSSKARTVRRVHVAQGALFGSGGLHYVLAKASDGNASDG
ncbi:hypothetical protein HPP92_012785 [Vanilla planifolia]|uniref:Uncharacterized protein n=1 Tax=Vanilla planifolia TaxID=51239 RepID=A0A835UU79_VANPL|nr:hypothetical protein HPP92_012785 [Vanilla planifolia]